MADMSTNETSLTDLLNHYLKQAAKDGVNHAEIGMLTLNRMIERASTLEHHLALYNRANKDLRAENETLQAHVDGRDTVNAALRKEIDKLRQESIMSATPEDATPAEAAAKLCYEQLMAVIASGRWVNMPNVQEAVISGAMTYVDGK